MNLIQKRVLNRHTNGHEVSKQALEQVRVRSCVRLSVCVYVCVCVCVMCVVCL
jgi:hypothetical protein